MPSLIGKTLRDQRRLAIGWLVGLACYAALYLSFYGRFEELTEAKMEAIPEGIRTAFGFADFQTGVGFLEAVIYGSIAPILLIVFAITLGNRGIAVAEEEGVLDLYLANPISRVRFLLFRYAVLLGTVLAAVCVLLAVVLAYVVGRDMGVGIANLLAATVGLLLLALVFGTLAFAVGAATGRRAAVLAVSGTAAVATYLCKAIPDLVEGMYWLRWLSPFHYATGNQPLHNGLHLGYTMMLVGLVGILLTAAAYTFDRRDVAVA